jgi:ABC-type multidrug transport system fused ATPase/permease subunit
MAMHETSGGKTPDSLGEIRNYGWGEIGRRCWPLVLPHRWRALLAAGLVALVGVAVALQPLFAKYVIDEAIPQRSIRLALMAAGVFLVVMFVRMALWFWAMTIVYRTNQAIVFKLRTTSFAHLQRLCVRFHNQFPSGFIYERVFGNSINTLGNFMQVVFSQLVTYVVGLIFSLGVCFYLSPLLTLVILGGTVGYVAAARVLSRRMYAKSKEANEAGMHIVGLIMDKLRGHKTIQSFALEERVQEEFDRQLWPAMVKWMAGVLESMKLSFVTEGLSYLITAAVIVGGAWLVMRDPGRFPLGTLVAFMGYQGTLIGMIQAMTNVYGQVMGARSAFDQLFTVLDTNSTLQERPGAAMPARFEPRLEFRSVSFAYADQPVLKDLNLEIPANKTVALVGRSGSGKTTIANLLIRFYDPTSGSILLDGQDIRDLPQREYRALFGVVLQDPFMFDTTIEANLRCVRPDVSEAELVDVLKRACAWEFIDAFPEKLRHHVGEGGGQLSGGQRQRLAIARCMLTRSRIVILDEATSALDPESEEVVQQGFNALCKDRTVVVIAHRLSTIRRVDRIVVLEQGRVAEQGTFDSLLASGGLFARLHSIATSTSTHRIKLEDAGFA